MSKILLIFLLFTSACGAKVVRSPELLKNNSPYIALVPSKEIDGISRERLVYLMELVRLKLESRGYLILDPDIIEYNCNDENCSNRVQIGKNYGIDKISYIDVDSTNNLNIFAAYYNSISGKFVIEDVENLPLYSAEYTQRDSGGLLLESGQVIQAIINQARNGDESSIDRMASKFVSALLKELPEVKNVVQREPLLIEKVEQVKLRKNLYRVCAKGSSGHFASLVLLGGDVRDLREVSSGNYCGAVRIAEDTLLSASVPYRVELRSAFGDMKRWEAGK